MLVTTTRGLVDDAEMRRVETEFDDDNEHTTAVEFWIGDELVHRSVHVRLKKGLNLAALAAEL